MADLIAQGEQPQQRWRRALVEGQSHVLGRAAGVWSVPWDNHVSRRHVVLEWDGHALRVTRLPEAGNPMFFRGRDSNECLLQAGDHFVIGDTTFTLADQQVHVEADAPSPAQQQSFSPQSLKKVSFRNPDHRIEVLIRLPEAISGAADDEELCVRLVSMLLAGVPRTELAAVVAVEEGDRGEGDSRSVRVLHWDQRLMTGRGFQPSQRLILEAISTGRSLLHVWHGAASGDADQFTAQGNVDWAYCTPIADAEGAGWALYLAGRLGGAMPNLSGSTDPHDLREDIKFTELVATSLSSLLQMRRLERRQAGLSQFFSPVVLSTLAVEDPDVVLAPRETEVSVLFCDLRGFSLEAERSADNLLELLDRVSGSLGVMTHHILAQGGVVGDFQGDAAMGFWGWPIEDAQSVRKTALAALGIRAECQTAALERNSSLAGFNVGLGIATGRAVAGKIGSVDQVKVTVFGPVVNLASRLEGMTKILRAPILLDDTTAAAIRQEVPREVARVRRLAVVRPFGLEAPLEVSELLPPESDYPLLSDEHLEFCESALEAFVQGDWSRAFELLHRTPTEDRVTDFLTVYIAQHNRTAPPEWDGVITLASK